MTDAHAAVETVDGPPDYFEVLVAALRELLVAKGLIGADEVRAMVETLDAHGPTIGDGLVARAWADPDFTARLLDDATAVVEQSGIDNYDDTRFIVLEQTPQVHNLVVCTLCSCYPRPLLGGPAAGLVHEPALPVARRARAAGGAGGVRDPRAGGRADQGARQHREHAVPGHADAPGRDGGLVRAAAGRPGHARLHDRCQHRPEAVTGRRARPGP